MIGIGFAERLAGGHHPIGDLEPDKPFTLELVAEPTRNGWRAHGTLRREAIAKQTDVHGVIVREGELLCYRLVVEGEAGLAIEAHKVLRLRDPYASLSMWNGVLRADGRDIARLRARVDLRSEWRYCLQNLTISRWSS